MKHWVLIGFGVVILLVGCKFLNLGAIKLPTLQSQGAASNPVLGRWDEVDGIGFIRFFENGWFRSDISGNKREGTYVILEGGGVEFTVSYQTIDPRTKKKGEIEKDIQEYKYTLDGNILRLRIGSLWFAFKKATDAPEPSPQPPPGLVPAATPGLPAVPKKGNDWWREA
jgi:hypothetical protein